MSFQVPAVAEIEAADVEVVGGSCWFGQLVEVVSAAVPTCLDRVLLFADFGTEIRERLQ